MKEKKEGRTKRRGVITERNAWTPAGLASRTTSRTVVNYLWARPSLARIVLIIMSRGDDERIREVSGLMD